MQTTIPSRSRITIDGISLRLGRDINGNQTLRVKPTYRRGFSIQTNGNLPGTHRDGITEHTRDELTSYVLNHGTTAQRAALGYPPKEKRYKVKAGARLTLD